MIRKIIYLFIGLILSSQSLLAQEAWTLEKCIQRAWEMNIDVQKASLNQDIASINLKQGRLSQLPTLNAGATHGYNWGQTIDPFTNEFATDRVRNNNLFLSSELSLFNGFRLRNNIEKLKFDFSASELDLMRRKNDIGLLVAQRFLNILFNQEQLKAAQEQVKISEVQVERMQRLVDVGQEAIASLLQLQAQLASDELNATRIENSLVVAKTEMSNLLLLDDESSQAFQIAVPEKEVLIEPLVEASDVFESAKEKLPQMKAADLRTKSAQQDVKIAQSGRSPQVSVRGSLGSGYSGNNKVPVGNPIISSQRVGLVEGSNEVVIAPKVEYEGFEPKAFDQQLEDNFNQSLSLSLNIPLFNANQVNSDIARSKIGYDIARLDLQNAENQLRQEVQTAHNEAVAAQRNFQAANKAKEAADLDFGNSQKRFEQGLMNSVDFNVSKSRAAMAETDAIRARYELLFRQTILDFYLGKPLSLD